MWCSRRRSSLACRCTLCPWPQWCSCRCRRSRRCLRRHTRLRARSRLFVCLFVCLYVCVCVLMCMQQCKSRGSKAADRRTGRRHGLRRVAHMWSSPRRSSLACRYTLCPWPQWCSWRLGRSRRCLRLRRRLRVSCGPTGGGHCSLKLRRNEVGGQVALPLASMQRPYSAGACHASS